MIEKRVSITMCLTCPYFLEDDAGMDCLFNEIHFDDSFRGTNIPDWCGLPNSDELPEWFVKTIKNTIYGFKQAGDGRDYRDGYQSALKWVLSLRRGDE